MSTTIKRSVFSALQFHLELCCNNETSRFSTALFDWANIPGNQVCPLSEALGLKGNSAAKSSPIQQNDRSSPEQEDHSARGRGAISQEVRLEPERRPGTQGVD